MTDRSVRAGGIAGLIFVALILVAVFAAGNPPAADDAADKIRDFLVDHRGAIILGNLFGLLGIPFVLWFGVVLRESLRGDAMSNALGTTSLAGLLVTAPM